MSMVPVGRRVPGLSGAVMKEDSVELDPWRYGGCVDVVLKGCVGVGAVGAKVVESCALLLSLRVVSRMKFACVSSFPFCCAHSCFRLSTVVSFSRRSRTREAICRLRAAIVSVSVAVADS